MSIKGKIEFERRVKNYIERERAKARTLGLGLQGLYFSEIVRKETGDSEFLEWHNDVVNQGKNAIMNCYFNAGSAFGTAYMGLITNSSFTGLSPTDVMTSHTGWVEFTGYSGGARPAWGQGTAASQQLTNATQVTFNINTSTTLTGGFIVSDSTLGGTAGTLWSTGLLTAGNTSVNNGDVFKNSYILLC